MDRPILTTDERGKKFIDGKFVEKIKLIDSSPLNKKKLIFFLKILFATIKSIIFIFKTQPKFIFGMGGYASFPVCFAGIILRIPFIIYENNLLMGKANRYLAPFAKKIFVSYKDIQGINIKHKEKVKVIGNILRESILNYSKISEGKQLNDLNLLVLGGSQPQRYLLNNYLIFYRLKKNNINLKVYQQCLDEQKIKVQKIYDANKINYELFSFTFDVLKYYNLTNLVISRAGSSALAEFLNCRIPIISIPLASSSENHQLKNAQYFSEKGFSLLVEEKDIKNKLFNLLELIHKDKSMLKTIETNQKKHSDKNVFVIVNKEITKLFYEN